MSLRLSYSLADQEFIHTKSLGVWNVSTQLLGHLARHPQVEKLTVFTNRTQTRLPNLGPKIALEEHNCAVHQWGRGWGRVYWDQWGVYEAAKQSDNPWLFLPKGFSPIYRRCPVRLAAYVHDAMHDHYRNQENNYSRNPLAREAGYFMRSLRATLREAEVIFTNSDFTKSEVFRLSDEWNLPAPKVITAGIGFELLKTKNPGASRRERVVVLAGQWPHKCTDRAVNFMQRWVKSRGFTGGTDWIGALPPGEALPQLPGWKQHQRLSQDDYDRVLGNAAVVVYFSAYEGFGMPPVEGTLAGAAAVYSAIPAMQEVMGECGFQFRNDSYEEFAGAMDRALRMPPEQLANWQRQLSERHSWVTIADRIAGQLQALAEVPERERKTVPATGLSCAKPASRTKITVFAHTPPPHHGQSYMVKLMLDGFGGDQRGRKQAAQTSEFGITCLHINARFSKQLVDIGDFSLRKVALSFKYCIEAIWCRYRYGVKTLYYVPAPGKLSALFRDWLVMALCRPFYKRIIFHWHAAGMAEWLDSRPSRTIPRITGFLLGRADLSIVLTHYNRVDAEKLRPRNIRIAGNGIPDPCPDFEETVLPRRLARFVARRKISAGEPLSDEESVAAGPEPDVFNILFLAHCIREKGLFDTLDGVAIAAAKLAALGSRIRLRLIVAGEFMIPAERAEFTARIQKPDLMTEDGQPLVIHVGFVSGQNKRDVFINADCFCFPTYYYAESFGLVLVEAMSFGLPIITSRWRSVPELMLDDNESLVDPRSPDQVAEAILRIMLTRSGRTFRRVFVERFRLDKHLANIAAAIHSLDEKAS